MFAGHVSLEKVSDLRRIHHRTSYKIFITVGRSTAHDKKTTECHPPHLSHDDVIQWNHFPRYWPFVWGIDRSPVNSPHKGQWRGALMFSLICTRINDWVNNREAGDLRRHRGHYDVNVMLNINWLSAVMTIYVCCATWFMWHCRLSWVSIIIADDLAPYWRQDIYNHAECRVAGSLSSESSSRSLHTEGFLMWKWFPWYFTIMFSGIDCSCGRYYIVKTYWPLWNLNENLYEW